MSTVSDNPNPTEHFDVVVVGAGISGVGAAYHLQDQCPDKSFVVLENQSSFGGTWRTHRYPGIRSDSDLYTFGYRFKPWTGAPIATSAEILSYMNEVIQENSLDDHIRYGQQILSADWSAQTSQWRLQVACLASGVTREVTAGFLWMCQGYYRHAKGYTPEWPGMEDFKGQIVHPQSWPEDLDYQGKSVVVIGSGASAATIVPAMAPTSKQVTMLQRSPTFFTTGRNANALADTLRELDIQEDWIHEIVRRKILFDQSVFTRRARTEPDVVKQELLDGVRNFLGDDFDIDTHFTPKYRPWRQRIAFIPEGDLFEAIKQKQANVVTDEIERFTESGLLLKSGATLDADLVVTATGFDLSVMGDIQFSLDGKQLDFADSVTYRGMMFAGVPNMAWVFGYFRASWTLRTDLVGDFICRLLKRMDASQSAQVVPTLRPQDADMQIKPWIDNEDFNPGYLSRSAHLLPQQGDRQPWIHTQDYWADKDELPAVDLDDGSLKFS
ncbi:MAG: flavin-containing monooxygenase [Burkholderiaceae bacterium]